MKKPDIFVKSPMMQVADKTQPPILFPTISPNLYTAVGELMVQWALMEQNLNIVIWALLTYNSTNEDGWKKRGFEKRWELLKAEWAKFSKGHEALLKFLDSANHNIRLCKVLRDSLAHKEMTLGMMQDGNHFVQFYNETRTKQKSKPYDLNDFNQAVAAARNAAGWLYWLTDPESAWPLPLPDTQQLRNLPNTDHLRLPI